MAARFFACAGRDVYKMGLSQIRRRGRVDPKLIIALVVVALGAGIYWWIVSRPDPELAGMHADANATYTLICPKCEKSFPITGGQRAKMTMQKGCYQCPQCKQFVAYFGSEEDLKKPKSDQPRAIMP